MGSNPIEGLRFKGTLFLIAQLAHIFLFAAK